MNQKQCRELRRAIKERFPNISEEKFKMVYKEAKKQFKQTPLQERAEVEIN